MTSIEAATMFGLYAWGASTTGFLAWLAFRWWIHHHWIPAGEKAEALADLSKPQPAEDGLTHLVSVVSCRMCRDLPDGKCTCEIDCYHIYCTGGHCTTITTLPARQRRGLRKAGKR